MAANLTRSFPNPGPPQTLSWAATLAALTAFGTLALTYGTIGGPDSISLLILMGLLLALRLTRWHLPPASWAHWVMRLALFAPIIAINWDKFNDPQLWLFDTTAVGAFGILAAAELTTQAARTLPADQRNSQTNSGAICLLSGYVFLAACTTDQMWPIRIASPIYFALAVLSLPRFEAARQGSGSEGQGGGERGRAAAIGLALALGLGINMLFWVFRVPLMQLGAGSLHDRPASEATGISVQPSLGPTFGLRGSTVRVLRVENDNGRAYLRGLTFDTYGGGRWGPISDRRHPTANSLVTASQTSAPPEAMQITTLAPVRGILFVPLGATGLSLPPGDDLPVQQNTRSNEFFVRAFVPPPYAVSFSGTGIARTNVLSAQERARDLAVPPDLDSRAAALARQLTQTAATPAAKAAAIQAFFLQNFQYSLTIHPGPGDPVSSFILGRKSAHCEFFASGAVLMLRAAGLPARYVTGYYAHETLSPGLTLVRQQDAHAWAEVWLAPQGWTTLDATPAAGRPPATAAPISKMQRALEWVSDQVAVVRAWLGQFTTGQILGGLAALVAVPWAIRQAWRAWHRPPPHAPELAYTPPAEMDALARRFEAWLRRAGVPCPPHVPWAEHAQAAGLPEDAVLFVRRYNEARFGSANLPTVSVVPIMQELAEELHRLEQSRWKPAPAEQDAVEQDAAAA